jgi:hypothetical protein
LTIENLDELNVYNNETAKVYLASIVDVTTNPEWLRGEEPDHSGMAGTTKSCAIIISDRGSGTVDVFYMYFYAYNRGTMVFLQDLGNHLGDWEHTMIRFKNEIPTQIWLSQHNNGEAFTYAAVEKIERRPAIYSARGSHANYATTGTHDHTIPNLNLPHGLIQDYTSKGKLWDPTLNAYFYAFNETTCTFASALMDGESPLGVMNFKGRWGDHQLPDDDPRQRSFLGFRKFVGGPTGPIDKQLNRTWICPDNGFVCLVRNRLGR